jgi:CheY-like chemotaxis protein
MLVNDPHATRLLLVEDERAHAELIRMALDDDRSVTELDHVADGEQAIDYLQRRGPHADRQPVDLMLLDLNLPRADGLEVLKTVRTDPRLKTMPVVALTTSARAEDIQQAGELQVNSYLVKPVDFDRFREMIKHLTFYWTGLNRHHQRY